MNEYQKFEREAAELKSKLELVSLLERFGSDPETNHGIAIARRDARESLKNYIGAAKVISPGFGSGA